MRPSLKGALALSLLAFSTTLASAAPKEDVAAATAAWGSALGEDNPDKVLPLYSDDAVLWARSPRLYALIRLRYGTISFRLSKFYQS